MTEGVSFLKLSSSHSVCKTSLAGLDWFVIWVSLFFLKAVPFINTFILMVIIEADTTVIKFLATQRLGHSSQVHVVTKLAWALHESN